MTRRTSALIALTLLLLAACGGKTTAPAILTPLAQAGELTAATETAVATDVVLSPSPTPPVLVTRVGADYVLRLPREDAVPANWAMSPLPDFQSRAPQPGDTYRFACRDLPARSIGIATVGYRHLDGLPSVAIEYVIYGSAADAADALADMRAAAETCGDFTLGAGGATTAAFAPLDFPELGDERFAVALSTSGDASGDLLTHVVKVRQSHIVIGISHTTYADEAPPDGALTRALVERAINNLRDAPQPLGPTAKR